MAKHPCLKAAILASTAFTSLFAVHAQALAQQPAAESSQPVDAPEIIVTANRRAEALQDVPSSISVLGAEKLREQNIATAQDLLGKVPSVVVTSNGTQRSAETVTIRGQGQTYLGPVGVVNYFAEVPLIQGSIIANQGGPGTFFDLENLQVLRGPQGTLFGKNTTGGALLLTPKKPTDKFEGYVQAQLGNYTNREVEGAINVPIAGDKLMVRVAGKYVTREGFTKDVGPQAFGYPDVCGVPGGCPAGRGRNPGYAGRDYDDRHYWTARLGVTWRPAEGIENYLLAYYTKSHDNGTGTSIAAVNPNTLNLGKLASNLYVPRVPGAALFDGTRAAQIVATQQALGPRRTALNTDQFSRLKTWGITDIFSAELTDNLTFRNIVGYQRMKHDFAWDLDGSIIPVLSQEVGTVTAGAAAAGFGNVGDPLHATNLRQITEEPQLQGNALDGKLEYIVGGFYSKVSPEGPQGTGSFNAGSYNRGTAFTITTRSLAAFTQATLDLGAFSPSLDGLKLTSGIRHTWDKFHGRRSADNLVLLPIAEAGNSSEATTWTLGIDYQPMKTLLLYAKATRGYKAGGFNYAGPRPTNITFGPEQVTSYEIGFKSDMRISGMPLQVNVSAYHSDYKGIQRATADNIANGCTNADPTTRPARCALIGNTTGLDQGATIFNAGSGRIQGIEVETSIRPTRGLTLSANYAYMDGKYKDFTLNATADPLVRRRDSCNGPVAVPVPGVGPQTVPIDLTCIPFSNTPKHQFSLDGRYEFDAGNAGKVTFAANYSWVAKAYQAAAFTPADDPYATRPSYGLLNLSLSWDSIFGSGLDARAFMTNATNKTYLVSAPLGYSTSTGTPAAIYGEPRMYGLSLRYRFGE